MRMWVFPLLHYGIKSRSVSQTIIKVPMKSGPKRFICIPTSSSSRSLDKHVACNHTASCVSVFVQPPIQLATIRSVDYMMKIKERENKFAQVISYLGTFTRNGSHPDQKLNTISTHARMRKASVGKLKAKRFALLYVVSFAFRYRKMCQCKGF